MDQDPAGFPLDVPEVRKSIDDVKDNLKAALGIDPGKTSWTLGPKLAFDPEAEKFLNNPQADELLTRKPREPYAVPAEV